MTSKLISSFAVFLFILFTYLDLSYAVEPEKTNDLIGMEIPLFSLKDQNDNLFILEDQIGKVMVINFFFTGCKNCIKELPMLNKLKEELPKDKFVLVVINGTKETPDEIKSFFKSINVEGLSALVDSFEIQAKRFAVDNYPVSFLVNKKGIIVDVFEGFTGETMIGLKDKILTLINK